MKKIIVLVVGVFSISLSYSQIRVIGGNPVTVTTSSAFLDATSSSTYDGSANSAKGIVFPRVNLTTFTSFLGVNGTSSSFRTRYDGFLVYNTATSGVAGVGATQGTLSPGFWYYDNNTAGVGTGSISGGTWRPLSVGASNTIIKGLVNCDGTITQTITDTNVTATSTISVTYEDPTGDIIQTTIKDRQVGAGFTLQFAAVPPNTAKVNYVILP